MSNPKPRCMSVVKVMDDNGPLHAVLHVCRRHKDHSGPHRCGERYPPMMLECSLEWGNNWRRLQRKIRGGKA